MKILSKPSIFAILYILFMLPTYLLPYIGSNSAGMMAIQNMEGDAEGSFFFTFIHLGCLACLVAITWFRAKFVNKTWIVIFPILAAVFDFVPTLSLIPLVPTVMHIIAIVKGVSESNNPGVSTTTDGV